MENYTGWHGSLNLGFARRRNSTQIIEQRSQAPLKVQRPFYPEGAEVCHSTILHTAGGMVGGDRLSINIDLAPETQATITTAAASKVYRSNGQRSQQTINIQVAADAVLEWLPQETIIFNGAVYRQDLRVELAKGATWLGWEIVRFGRSARGEEFLQGEWRSHSEIYQQGYPLWIDRQWLPAGEAIIRSPHGLAGKPIVASLSWVGKEVTPEIVREARQLWTEMPHQPGEIGVTRLTCGLLCRYRGAETPEVRNWFIAVWHLLRCSFFQRPSCLPRVWPK